MPAISAALCVNVGCRSVCITARQCWLHPASSPGLRLPVLERALSRVNAASEVLGPIEAHRRRRTCATTSGSWRSASSALRRSPTPLCAGLPAIRRARTSVCARHRPPTTLEGMSSTMAEHDNTGKKTSITKQIDVGKKGVTTRYKVKTTRVDPATGQPRFNFRTQSRPPSK